jgi:8-oxo-dGTP pyrophosphatase MutT (NUDIX family)
MNFPVSIKGVLVEAGRVVLLENERDEWELPGGRLEPGEPPGFDSSRASPTGSSGRRALSLADLSLGVEGPSASVHARLGRLQAIDRE